MASIDWKKFDDLPVKGRSTRRRLSGEMPVEADIPPGAGGGDKPMGFAGLKAIQKFKKNKQPKLKPIRLFHRTTTLHGFLHYDDASETAAKVFWAITIIVCLVMLLRGTATTLYNYATHPVTTSVSEINMPAMVMPDLSVCFPHRVNKSFVESWGLDLELLEYMNAVFMANYPNSYASKHSLEEIEALNIRYDEFKTGTPFDGHHIERFYEDGALSCEQMIQKCVFNGQELEGHCCEHVEPIMMNYGVCFLVEPILEGFQVEQLFAGPHGGLMMLFQTHPEARPQTFYNSFHDDGVYVHIGHPHIDHKPVPLDNAGISVPNGFHGFVGLDVKKVHSIRGYGCSDELKLAFFDGYEQQVCLYECILNQTLKACNCVPLGYNVSHHLPEGAQVCDPYEANTCMNPYVFSHPSFDVTREDITTYTKELIDCEHKCGHLCDYEEYIPKVQYMNIPANQLRTDYRKYYNLTDHMNVREHFILVEIYFNHISEETVEQIMSATVDELFSNIGGQYGLFIGGSIISIVHFFTHWCSNRESKGCCCCKKADDSDDEDEKAQKNFA